MGEIVKRRELKRNAEGGMLNAGWGIDFLFPATVGRFLPLRTQIEGSTEDTEGLTVEDFPGV